MNTENRNWTEEQKRYLDNCYRFFKYERLAWKIQGIVILVMSLIWFALGTLFFLFAIGDLYVAAPFGVLFVLYGIIFLPLAIIALVMVKKAEHYMEITYTDIEAVKVRCNSVGMIVFSVLFGAISPIFIIINFCLAKSNARIFDEMV